jgi:hypothetical protein
MLARRFTIVCLLTALFGMFFASLVAQSEGPRMAHANAHMLRCAFIQSFDC